MAVYRVEWYVDIEASSPEQAARAARQIQLDLESTDTVFNIFDRGPVGAFIAQIDIGEIDAEKP